MAISQAHESWPTFIISGPLPRQEPELTLEDKALLWDPPVLEPRCCDSRWAGLRMSSGRISMLSSSEFIALLYEFLELPALPIACVSQGPAVKDVVSKVWLLSHHLWHLEGPKETRALFESPKIL